MSAKWTTSHADQAHSGNGFRSHESASPASESSAHEHVFHFKHRVSCHRCGNMRKARRECVRCPHVYCHQCEGKMVEQFGPNIFKDGCPVCKELCCCGVNRSFTCPHKYHCYKKCPSTKRHSYKTATGFATASKRCMKSQMLLREIAAGHIPGSHSEDDDGSHDHHYHHHPHSDEEDRPKNENVRRSARISQLYSSHHKPLTSYAEFDDSQSETSEHDREHDHDHADGHTSDGETSSGSESGEHSHHGFDDHHHDHHQAYAHDHDHDQHLKRTSSQELLAGAEKQPVKVMRQAAQPPQAVLPTPGFGTMMAPAAPVMTVPQMMSTVAPQQPFVQPPLLQQPAPQVYQPPLDWSEMLEIDMHGLLENFGDWDDDWLTLDEAELQRIF